METPKQFFFAFSKGEYSDYCMSGLYVCDHEVTEAEWDAYYKVFQDESDRLAKIWQEAARAIPIGSRTAQMPEYVDWQRYRRENDPETLFQKMHNMQPVEYQEFWRD